MFFILPTRYLKVLVCFIALLLSACSSLQQQSIKGPGWYRVKPTDTLYSVAWRYGLDHQQLAKWNGLSDPYIVNPGQQLILIEPEQLPAPIATKIVSMPDKIVSAGVKVKPVAPSYNQVLRWRWPTKGKVHSRFSKKHLDQRGIDIAGKIGQPVVAVADGKVVYSGTGLSGYGNLIIIKHNDLFLSAYAYNQKRLVSEGISIKKGTQIAEMGLSKMKGNKNLASLHFQIRKKGKPVDPLLYLPDRKN